MDLFRCPICHQALSKNERQLSCEASHQYDLARQGYVNLLPAHHRKSKLAGDSPEMINARSRFLNAGLYDMLADQLTATIGEMPDVNVIADLGCGEGYFTNYVSQCAEHTYGIDISKAGISAAARTYPALNFAVGNIMTIPLISNAFSVALVVMAPLSDDTHRILQKDGYLVRVTPGADHLMEFKKQLYNEARQHKDASVILDRFGHLEQLSIRGELKLDNAQINALLAMTPMQYRSSKVKAAQLSAAESFSTESHFCIDVFKKVQSTWRQNDP